MTTVVAAVIELDRKILVCQRNASGPHPLKWEFPGGKVEAGESEADALRRELREELGIQAKIGPEITRYEYTYPGKSPILLVFYQITGFRGSIQNRVFATTAWEDRNRLTAVDFLEGDIDLLQILTSRGKAES